MTSFLALTHQESAPRLSDLVLYAVESKAGSTAVKNIVQSLADAGIRAIVVVDRCPAETHQDAAMVKRASSRLSLGTIDHELRCRTIRSSLSARMMPSSSLRNRSFARQRGSASFRPKPLTPARSARRRSGAGRIPRRSEDADRTRATRDRRARAAGCLRGPIGSIMLP